MFSFANFALQLIGREWLLCQVTRFSTVIISNIKYSYSTKQNIFNSRGLTGLTAGVACNVFLSSRKFSLPFSLTEKIVQLF